MAYNPITDFVALWRAVSGGVRKVDMPGLDFFVAALGRSGLINIYVSETAPLSNQATTAWFQPTEPTYTAEGNLFLWNANTNSYQTATMSLFFEMLTAAGVASSSPVAISSLLDTLGSAQGSLIFRGATDWEALGPGTVNQILMSGGAGASPAWDSGASFGVLSFNTRTGSVVAAQNDYTAAQIGADGVVCRVNLQTFTGSGTYTPSSGLLYAIIETWGGGGGGGGVAGATTTHASAGGGGAGSKSLKLVSAADVGVSKVVTVGAGGAGGAAGNHNGAAGGDTSVGTLCVGKGGAGGVAAVGNTQIPAGGLGGVAGTGDVTGTGMPGGTGFAGPDAIYTAPGFGGSTEFGGGGIGISASASSFVPGQNGTGYGGGGSGGSVDNGSATTTGGNGVSGFVKITEFLNQ